MKKRTLLTTLLAVSISSQAAIFNIEVTNETLNQKFTDGYNNVQEAIDSLDTDAIKQHITYNDTDNLKALLDFRGLPARFSFAANSNKLIFEIPSLNITETFEGASRDDSINMLDDWFKTNGSTTVERIMKELARVSPVDPVAGNPNSAMTQSVDTDFNTAFTTTVSRLRSVTASTVDTNGNENLIIISPTFKSLDIDGKNSKSYQLPLAYAFVSNDNSKKRFTISLPISYVEVDGAKSYALGLGLAYSYPIYSNWIVTPAIKYNTTGSEDLGSLAQIASGSLTSAYTFDLGDRQYIHLGNMIGYYETVDFFGGDYAYDPGITNVVYRNGLMYSFPTDTLVSNTSLEVFGINTQYTGTALYLNSYNEFGFSFGYNKVNVNVISDDKKYAYERDIKIGLSYLTSSKANGIKVNFGFIW